MFTERDLLDPDSPAPIRSRVGGGSSELPDGASAGRAAAGMAIRELAGEPPGLVLVWASVRYDLTRVLAGIREVTGTTPLAGATSAGHFLAGALTEPGCGVAVLVLSAGPYRFGVASSAGLAAHPMHTGSLITRAARAAAGPNRAAHSAVLLLADSMAGNQQALLTGVHWVAGSAVPVAGGSAGDDRHMVRTSVFHDGAVLADAAVAVWIDSPHPLRVVVEHGWRPLGPPLLVTRVDGQIVKEIAGRPATEVYREHFPAHEQIERQMRTARQPGWHSHHAFGLIEPDGTQLIRGAFIGDDGEIRTFTPLPQYAAVQVVSSGPDELLDVADRIVEGALADRRPSVLLIFSCVARLNILCDRGAEEPARLQAAAKDVPVFGFFTYGEYARTNSVAGVHNATVAAIAL